jgi:RNA polymerase sigma-70 factor (ECF subfamily)
VSNSAEDSGLIDDCLAGRSEAFAELIRKYQDRLYNTIYHIVGNAEDARDLVQDVFVQAYRSLEAFQGRSAFYTWIYRIGVNMAISHRRRRRVMVPLETGPRGLMFERAEEHSDPGGRLEQDDREREVREAIASLAPEYRAVIVMKDIDGQKYEAIAQVLDCPIGTVRSRLHRARLELRQRLKHLMAD